MKSRGQWEIQGDDCDRRKKLKTSHATISNELQLNAEQILIQKQEKTIKLLTEMLYQKAQEKEELQEKLNDMTEKFLALHDGIRVIIEVAKKEELVGKLCAILNAQPSVVKQSTEQLKSDSFINTSLTMLGESFDPTNEKEEILEVGEIAFHTPKN